MVTWQLTLRRWRSRALGLACLPFLRGKGIAQDTADPVFRRLRREGVSDSAPRPPISVKALATLVESAMSYPGSTLSALGSGDALKAVRTFVDIYSRPTLTWDDLDFLRGCTDLPIVLKGIQHADDARRAVDAGMDGIMVSNHGGRQVDGAIGSIEALPAIVAAVGSDIEVWMDGGIRSGQDVLKAWALGARGTLIGRAMVYGLGAMGEAGVTKALQIIHKELDVTMAFCGHTDIRTVDKSILLPGTFPT